MESNNWEEIAIKYGVPMGDMESLIIEVREEEKNRILALIEELVIDTIEPSTDHTLEFKRIWNGALEALKNKINDTGTTTT